MDKKLSILFRADATSEIGFGHLMRSFALANHLYDMNCSISLATVAPYEPLVNDWIKIDANVIDLEGIIVGSIIDATKTMMSGNYDIIVIDGYNFNEEYISLIRHNGMKTVFFDDINDSAIAPDLLINQNVGAEYQFSYNLPKANVLLGASYSVIRKEIRCLKHVGGGGDVSSLLVARILVT